MSLIVGSAGGEVSEGRSTVDCIRFTISVERSLVPIAGLVGATIQSGRSIKSRMAERVRKNRGYSYWSDATSHFAPYIEQAREDCVLGCIGGPLNGSLMHLIHHKIWVSYTTCIV